jgi:type IV secretory pathway TraG/TraD family ATPase VirD4
LNYENDNFVADVAFLCEALIETEGNDPYWSNSARELIACLVMYVCVTENLDSPIRNLVEVRRLLTQSEKDLLNFLSDIAGVSDSIHKKDVVSSESNAESTPALDDDDDDEIPKIRDTKATDEELANINEEYLSKIEKVRNFRPIIQKANFFVGSSGSIPSIIAVARTQTNFLDDKRLAENLSRNDIDFLDMKTKKITVYIILPIKYLIAYSRWFRLLINSALSDMMSTHEKGDKNVLFTHIERLTIPKIMI